MSSELQVTLRRTFISQLIMLSVIDVDLAASSSSSDTEKIGVTVARRSNTN